MSQPPRQRMVAIELHYPKPEIEIQILKNETGVAGDIAERLVKIGQAIRQLDHEGLPEVASTRTLISTALLIKAGIPLQQAAEASIAGALSDDPVATRQLIELVKAYVV